MTQPTTAFGNRSVSDMRALVRAKLRRKSTDPLSGLSDSFVTEYIATWDAYFWDYARWTFARTSQVIGLVNATTLNGAVSAGDGTFTVNDANRLTAGGGRVSIQGDEIDYSSVTVAVATVSPTGKAISLSHPTNAIVDVLVAVPTDFGKSGELWVGDVSDPARVKLLHQDYRSRGWPIFPNYFVNDGYLHLPRNLSQTRALLIYYKKAYKAVDGDDLQTPRRWDNFVLYCALAECLQVTGNTTEADYYFNLAGIRTPRMQDEPAGILQYAASSDAEQTDSLDDFFLPE